METGLEALDQPLPKPRQSPEGYASARALEALLEGLIALRFLEEGLTRNAAGKAFQAWRALTGALLALERDKLLEKLGEEQRRWLLEKATPRIPSSRLKALGQLLEESVGIQGFSAYTDKALDLHDYQYHGPDPDAELSKYTMPGEAARDILILLEKLVKVVEEHVKPRLREAGKWDARHERALRELSRNLGHR